MSKSTPGQVKGTMKKDAVVAAYAKLSDALNECSIAVAEFADQFEATDDLANQIGLLKGNAPTATSLLETSGYVQGNGNGKKRVEHDELDSDEGKKSGKKVKKIKDPNAPKRPPSTYLVFQSDIRSKVKEANPEVSNTDLMKIISKQWAELDPVAKDVYVKHHAEQTKAFELEKKAYDDGLIIAAGGVPEDAPIKRKRSKKEPATADTPADEEDAPPATKKSKKDKAAPATPAVATPATATKKVVKAAKPVVVAPPAESSSDESSESSVASDDESEVEAPKASTSKIPAKKVSKKAPAVVAAVVAPVEKTKKKKNKE